MFLFNAGIGVNGNGEHAHQLKVANANPDALFRQLAMLRDFAGNANAANENAGNVGNNPQIAQLEAQIANLTNQVQQMQQIQQQPPQQQGPQISPPMAQYLQTIQNEQFVGWLNNNFGQGLTNLTYLSANSTTPVTALSYQPMVQLATQAVCAYTNKNYDANALKTASLYLANVGRAIKNGWGNPYFIQNNLKPFDVTHDGVIDMRDFAVVVMNAPAYNPQRPNPVYMIPGIPMSVSV